MCIYPKKNDIFLDRNTYLPIILLLLVYITTGCNATSSKQFYENTETGISLERPGNWELAYVERNGMIVLASENGIWDKDSVRIEIHGPACVSVSTDFKNPYEEVEWNIDRIRKLYNLDSITVVQEPTTDKVGDYEITKSIIMIPSTALPEDSSRNQVGVRDPEIFQTIDIIAITNGGNTIMTYIYEGNSDVLNAQAQEIITSIQITCSNEP
jgi:hypothetical protein